MSSVAPTRAAVLARTLREAGIKRMFGLPGGEILEFIHAAKREGIEFLLTRHEAAASFLADVTGRIQRQPGVCVATLGPGAVNMTLGVANASLDRSPLIAVTATMSASASPFATHQNLDLNAVYRPFTKMAITLDARDTAAKVRRAIRESVAPRMGPVHSRARIGSTPGAVRADRGRPPEGPRPLLDCVIAGGLPAGSRSHSPGAPGARVPRRACCDDRGLFRPERAKSHCR